MKPAVPRLHVVTDADVLRSPGFAERAGAVLAAGGADVALHVRGHGLGGRALYEAAARAKARARNLGQGALILVNDRIDVALAAGAGGIQVGVRSLSLAVARRLVGGDAQVGYSAHSAGEAAEAVAAGADFVLVGSVYSTATHPGASPAGLDLLRAARKACGGDAQVLAIGGVTPERVAEVVDAGASGVAVLSGVWTAADAGEAVAAYRAALKASLGAAHAGGPAGAGAG